MFYRCVGFVLALLVTQTSAGVIQENPAHHYMLVIDAGSTGSRAHFFQYDLDNESDPIHIVETKSKKINIGFGTIPLTQKAVNGYLSLLLNGVTTAHTKVPVYFYGTAGMRLLSHAKQDEYYQYVKHWFEGQPSWRLLQAQTISGKQEGILDWLAANQSTGALAKDNGPLVKVMDMGGASVQVVFPVHSTKNIQEDDLVTLSVGHRSITLFVHSFLGLGATEVMHQEMENPACFSIDYVLPSGRVAQGDLSSCAQRVASIVNEVHQVEQRIKPAIDVSESGDWYVMGGLSYLAQEPIFAFAEKNQFTMNELTSQAQSHFCAQSWPTLDASAPQSSYLYTYCFLSAYYDALLSEGYTLDRDTPIHYFSATQNNSGWTLGVVLQHHE